MLLIAGAIAAFISLGGLIGAPLTWLEARATRKLPQPSAEELATLAPGTEAIVGVQLADTPVSADHGLLLYSVERSEQGDGADEGSSSSSSSSSAAGWTLQTPPVATIQGALLNGAPVTVQLHPNSRLLNAQTIVDSEEPALRYVGYRPGQALAVRGSWEGSARLTAEVLYAGTPQSYVEHVGRAPGFALLSGLACGALAVVFLFAGAALRFAGV